MLIKGNLLSQSPTGRLNKAALKLVAEAIRVNNLTGFGGDDGPIQMDFPTVFINVQFHHNCRVTLSIFILGKGDAPARACPRRLGVRFPVGLLSRGSNYRLGAFIGEVI